MSVFKKKKSGFFSSNIFVLIILLLVLLVGFSYVRIYYSDYQVKREKERLIAGIEDLNFEKLKILDLLAYAQTDGFVEEKARTELNMIKPGEKMVIIKGKGIKDGGQKKREMIKSNKLLNLKKWYNFFIN